MKKLLILVMVSCFAFAKADAAITIAIQEFVSHQVQAGETVYSIAKKYKLKEKQIIKLNPDARRSIYEGLVLILPAGSKDKTVSKPAQDNIKFKKHKVRRKETLFSISKKYGVSIDVIKRFNKELYSNPLRKGDRIQIPLNFKETTEVVTSAGGGMTVDEAPKDGPSTLQYVVKAKETKWGIANVYSITIAELEALNPGMENGLKEGSTINVPNKQPSGSAVIVTSDFEFYEVVKGDTMYSLLRRLEMKADALVDLNPALADGLKEGMVLKIPNKGLGNVSITNNTITSYGGNAISLVDSINNPGVKHIAVMLPFGLDRVSNDTTMSNSEILRSDRVMRLSLDFQSGVLMAVQDAKEKGISVDLKVYDTAYKRGDGTATNARKIEAIINGNDFSNTDAVIGPLLGANVNRAASRLKSYGVPLISPLTPKVNMGSNVFQSRPSIITLRNKMLSYLKSQYTDQNVIIIADGKNATSKETLKAMFPNAKEVNPRSGDKGLYLWPDDIPNKISEFKENWILLETNDIPLISNVTTSLNALVATRKVTLFTTNKGTAYDSDEIQHMHLMNLQFHFPSMDSGMHNEVIDAFADAYEDAYGVSPSRFATRGYDITYDTILRLAYANDLYAAAQSDLETAYIENKFHYERSGSGFVNNAVYLMKYADGLMLEEVVEEDKDKE